MAILIDSISDNGLLPDGTIPLPEPVLIYRESCIGPEKVNKLRLGQMAAIMQTTFHMHFFSLIQIPLEVQISTLVLLLAWHRMGNANDEFYDDFWYH